MAAPRAAGASKSLVPASKWLLPEPLRIRNSCSGAPGASKRLLLEKLEPRSDCSRSIGTSKWICSEPKPRKASSRSSLTSSEMGVRKISPANFSITLSSNQQASGQLVPCMAMHGFTLVYIYKRAPVHEVKWISVEWIRVGWLRQTFCQPVRTEVAWHGFGLLCLALLGYKHALIDDRELLNTH